MVEVMDAELTGRLIRFRPVSGTDGPWKARAVRACSS